jgi:hypothetical protein
LVVTPHVKTNWVNDVANPAVNEANLEKYDDSLIALAGAHNALPTKRVRAATTSNRLLSGSSVNVDGETLGAGERVFVRAQTNATENGIYVVAAGSWSRAVDADSAAEFAGGVLISVERGLTNGGKVFRCTNSAAVTLGTTALTFEEVGAGGGDPGSPGVYATDGSTPLKYSAFLAEAGGTTPTHHRAALQNALNVLSATSPPAYSRYLDLEGARITLDQPVSLPDADLDHIVSVFNGEIRADPAFTGTHLLDGSASGSLQYKFINVYFNGNDVASWAKWTNGNLMFFSCHLYYPDADGANNPGLKAENQATFYVRQCRFWSGDGNINPSLRTRVAVHAVGDSAGDQKISSSVFAHFKHGVIYDAFVLLMTDCHIYQGNQGDDATPSYTAGIKFTRATFGSAIVNLYLDKCFIELSNETKPGTTQIGGIHIIGVKTLSVVEDADFAYIRVRDYHGQTGMRVQNIVIHGCQFSQDAAPKPKISATRLHTPASFDASSFESIHMYGNTFSNVNPESNPCTLRKNFGQQDNHIMDYQDYLPFGANPVEVLAIVPKRTAGSSNLTTWTKDGTLAKEINIIATAWGGDITCTVTCNTAEPADGQNFKFINT